MKFRYAAAAVLLLASCSGDLELEPSGPELSIFTNQLSYPASVNGPYVGVGMANNTNETVMLAKCNHFEYGYFLSLLEEHLVDGQWVAGTTSCPGEYISVALNPGDIAPFHYIDFRNRRGTFRFRAPLYQDATTIKPSLAVSDPIVIKY
jgi:hypothetical protein